MPEPRKPKPPADSPASAESFEEKLVARGEAARAVDGKLPPGATHEIIGETEDGKPILKRRRFSVG